MKGWTCQGSLIWHQLKVTREPIRALVLFTLQRSMHSNMRRVRLLGYSLRLACLGWQAGFISTCFYLSKIKPIPQIYNISLENKADNMKHQHEQIEGYWVDRVRGRYKKILKRMIYHLIHPYPGVTKKMSWNITSGLGVALSRDIDEL